MARNETPARPPPRFSVSFRLAGALGTSRPRALDPGDAAGLVHGREQDDAVKHPYQRYIVHNDAPKVKNLKTMFPELWREKPMLVSEAGKTN